MQPNSQQVIDFLDQAQHPLRSEIDYLRNIINNSAPELTEHIKWNAPSFMLNSDDCITFNLPPNQKTIRLVFHQGAKKKSSLRQGLFLILLIGLNGRLTTEQWLLFQAKKI